MKIVLIDDDATILDGLGCLIDWKKYGFDEVLMCDDSLNALELCRRERPEVVLVDVRMPGMNGLELIEALRKEPDESTYFIILSGYEDFSYAQQAIRLNVAEYLLKPVDGDELVRVLTGITSSIEEKRQMMSGMKPDGWNRMYYAMSRLIHGIAMEGDPRVAEAFQTDTPYQLLTFQRSDDSPWRTVDRYTEALVRQYKEQNIFPFLHQKYLSIVILEPKQSQFLSSGAMLQRWPDVQMCLSPVMPRVNGLGKLFKQIICCMELNNLLDNEWPLLVTEAALARRDISSLVEARESALIASLQKATDALDYAVMETVLQEIDGLVHRQDTFVKPEQIRKLLANAIRSVALVTYEQGSDGRALSAELLELSVAAYNKPYRVVVQGFQECLYRICYSKSGDVDTDALIESVKLYLHKNYASHTLTLSSVAEQYHINACYLSSVFHRKTGRRFWNYVVAIRLDQAEKLLQNSQLSIQSIAQKTGFNSNKTFYKSFKQRHGMTPTNWRKKVNARARPPETLAAKG